MEKKNPDYWNQRMAALEDVQYQKSAAYYKDVQAQYRRASNRIQMDIERWYMRLAENNDISYAGAKRLLKRNELEEFRWTVEQYIKAGEENAIDERWMRELENASARHHISYLGAMKLQAQQHAELLATEFDNGMTDFLYKSYGDQYYRNAFEIAKGTGIGSNLAKLDDQKVNILLQKPWAQDGKNFSDRIWTNKEKLVNNLHTELSQHMIRGASPQDAIDSLKKAMDVSRAQAGRLIMTESAAISSVAQNDCFKKLDVEQYEVLATLDSLTSKICQEMDGKVFERKDYEVGVTAPPFHPNCRSTTVPYFDDELTDGEERAARGEGTGKTVYVPADMTYPDWKKQFVEIEPQKNSSEFDSGLIRSQKELNQRANQLQNELEEYTDRKSKWSGKIVVNNERAKDEGFIGLKSWSCNIIVSDGVDDGTLFHELLHSASSSYYSVKDYASNRKLEEGVVEFLTKLYSKEKGLNYSPAYVNEVAVLENLNAGLHFFDDDIMFAKTLFNIPMTERYSWLSERVEDAIMKQNISQKDAIEVRKFLRFLQPTGGK